MSPCASCTFCRCAPPARPRWPSTTACCERREVMARRYRGPRRPSRWASSRRPPVRRRSRRRPAHAAVRRPSAALGRPRRAARRGFRVVVRGRPSRRTRSPRRASRRRTTWCRRPSRGVARARRARWTAGDDAVPAQRPLLCHGAASRPAGRRRQDRRRRAGAARRLCAGPRQRARAAAAARSHAAVEGLLGEPWRGDGLAASEAPALEGDELWLRVVELIDREVAQ